MCHCVPSTLTAYSRFRTQQLGLHTCDVNRESYPRRMTSICSFSTPIILNDAKCIRNGLPKIYGSRFELIGNTVNDFMAINRVAFRRRPSALGSSGFDFGADELGFKEEKRSKRFESLKRVGDEKFGDSRGNRINFDDGSVQEAGLPNYDDVLELDGALQEKKRDGEVNGGLEGDKLIDVEDKNNEIGMAVKGREEMRRGKQLMKRSNILAKQVISIKSALSLGFISELWVETNAWVVLVAEVRPNLLATESEKLLLEDIKRVGDVVLIQDEIVLADGLRMVGLETLVGYDVVTPGRRRIGKVRGYTFDIDSGALESLELDAFGMSIIPSSLVCTYALFVEDVIEVLSDTVIVHEAAASRIQRLTKGFWGSQNIRRSTDNLRYDSNVEQEPLEPDPAPKSRRTASRRKHRRRMGEIQDDWELPMDYL